MLISKVHKSIIIVMNSIDTHVSRNVFEAIQKTHSACFIKAKTTQLHLMVLNAIKDSCSFFKHYLISCLWKKKRFRVLFLSKCKIISLYLNPKLLSLKVCKDHLYWNWFNLQFKYMKFYAFFASYVHIFPLSMDLSWTHIMTRWPNRSASITEVRVGALFRPEFFKPFFC